MSLVVDMIISGFEFQHEMALISSASISEDGSMLFVNISVPEEEDKKLRRLKFPACYLRDCCASNFHRHTFQRLTPMNPLVFRAKMESVAIIRSGEGSQLQEVQVHEGETGINEQQQQQKGDRQLLQILWRPSTDGSSTSSVASTSSLLKESLGTMGEVLNLVPGEPRRSEFSSFSHVTDQILAPISHFSADFFLSHSLTRDDREARRTAELCKIQGLTAANFFDQKANHPFDFEDLMADDAICSEFIDRLWSYGLVFIRNVPADLVAYCTRIWNDMDNMNTMSRARKEIDSSTSHFLNRNDRLRKLVEQVLLEAENNSGTTTEHSIWSGELLANRISYLRETNYGRKFTVKTRYEDINNQAYTNACLPLHTDLPFYRAAPDIQMLHCLSQAPLGGGESFFVDGVAAALKLQKERPDLYDLLRTRKVRFADANAEYYLYDEKCIIEEESLRDDRSTGAGWTGCNEQDGDNDQEEGQDGDGDVNAPKGKTKSVITRVHYNEGVRCHLLNTLAPEEIPKFYEAMYEFSKIHYNDAELFIKFTLEENCMVAFNNNRVLHGRSKFEDGKDDAKSTDGKNDGSAKEPKKVRHLQGMYIDWDDCLSRRRVIDGEVAGYGGR